MYWTVDSMELLMRSSDWTGQSYALGAHFDLASNVRRWTTCKLICVVGPTLRPETE